MTDTKTETTTSLSYKKLVRKYKLAAKESAANVPKLVETLIIAETFLSREQYNEFCIEVGLDKDSPTYNKLMDIGEEAFRYLRKNEAKHTRTFGAVNRLDKLEDIISASLACQNTSA